MGFALTPKRTRELGLMKAESIIRKDLQDFNTFLEKNKEKCKNQLKELENQTALKDQGYAQLKNLEETRANKLNQNSKDLDKLDMYYGYKEFLDRLLNNDEKKVPSDPEAEKTQNELKKEFSNYYNFTMKPGLLAFLAEGNDEREDVPQPEKLIEYFQKIEEMNLKLIIACQDLSQEKTDLKKMHEKIKENYMKQLNENREKIKNFDHQIARETKQKNQLKKDKKDSKHTLEGSEWETQLGKKMDCEIGWKCERGWNVSGCLSASMPCGVEWLMS